jgi:hypothetical protein
MTARHRRASIFACAGLVAAIATLVNTIGPACKPGGDEGFKCNPLVFRDECNAGLRCKAFDCAESFCCPIEGTSADPHCNGQGCADLDAGDAGEDSAIGTADPSDAGG